MSTYVTSRGIRGFDALFCARCDLWLEDTCEGVTCGLCADRPARPSLVSWPEYPAELWPENLFQPEPLPEDLVVDPAPSNVVDLEERRGWKHLHSFFEPVREEGIRAYESSEPRPLTDADLHVEHRYRTRVLGESLR
ncbi:MAG: hypothetical protein RLO52_34160 [Sandaracinaceae bacterium]